MQDNPAPTSQLSWIPEFADISRAGDLGYTTGPWEIRRSPQDGPYAFGHYVTLWRKQANGVWKVELDYGISHEKVLPPEKVYSPSLPKDVARAASKAQADEAIAAIKNADRMASSSLLTYFAGDVRLYREDYLPYITKSAATRRLGETPGTMTSNQLAVRVSASADLGYSYGTAEFKPRDASKQVEYGNYVRIWKKQTDGSWKIVLDLLSSAPKP